MRRYACLFLAAMSLCGCSSLNPFGSKQKFAELLPIDARVTARVVWRESVGKGDLYSFTPAVVGATVYAAGRNGVLLRLDEGRQTWRVDTRQALSGGVGADRDRVVVASSSGEVFAFAADDGRLLWQARASGEILSPPVLSGGLAVVRSADNRLIAYDVFDGTRRWVFQRPMPALSIRTAAVPLVDPPFVFAGFPAGKLVAVNLENGVPVWEGTVTLPKGATELERAADITSPPVIFRRKVCAVAYQGRVSCFDLMNGSLVWYRNLSSAAGLSIDGKAVYVSDEKDAVHALDLDSGASLWKQDKLSFRRLTAPLPFGNYVVVADLEGVLHFLDKENGEFVGRASTDGSPIVAPLQVAGEYVLAQTVGGGIFAIGLE